MHMRATGGDGGKRSSLIEPNSYANVLPSCRSCDIADLLNDGWPVVDVLGGVLGLGDAVDGDPDELAIT
jgi:hypothetical protein